MSCVCPSYLPMRFLSLAAMPGGVTGPVWAQPWVFSRSWSLHSVPSKRAGCSIPTQQLWGRAAEWIPVRPSASLPLLHSACPLSSARDAARCQARPARNRPPPIPVHTQQVLGAGGCRQVAAETYSLHCLCGGKDWRSSQVQAEVVPYENMLPGQEAGFLSSACSCRSWGLRGSWPLQRNSQNQSKA